MLDRIEGKHADVANQAGMNTAMTRSDCEGTILQQEEPAIAREGSYAIHIDWHAEIMNDGYCLGSIGNGLSDAVSGHVAGRRIHINEPRCGSGQRHGVSRGRMGLGRYDDFITGSIPERKIDQMHSRRAGRNADGMRRAGKCSEISLKLLRDGPVNVSRPLQHSPDAILFLHTNNGFAERDLSFHHGHSIRFLNIEKAHSHSNGPKKSLHARLVRCSGCQRCDSVEGRPFWPSARSRAPLLAMSTT